MIRIFIVFLSLLVVNCGIAQEAIQQKPPLPAGPLLKRTATFSTWLVKFSYANDKPDQEKSNPPPPPKVDGSMSRLPPRRITIIRTGPLWHVIMVDIQGYTIDQWFDGRVAFFEASGLADTRIVTSQDKPYLGDYQASDFPDFQWISPETYVGIQKIGGADCLAFRQDDREAWINSETRYPVAWRKGAETRTFREMDPPTAMLVLPKSVEEISVGIKKSEEILRRPIPKGG